MTHGEMAFNHRGKKRPGEPRECGGSGGDRGELNSLFQAYNLSGLIARLVYQLSTLGETAGQIKRAFKDGTFEIFE
jgi:hypothetical protein